MTVHESLRERGYERVYFVHPRKTAGTSINHAFYGLTGNDPSYVHEEIRSNAIRTATFGALTFVAGNRHAIEDGAYFYGSSHIPLHEIAIPPATFTITSLRDPVERVVSHYAMLKHYVEHGVDKYFLDNEAPWLGDSFEDFVQRLPPERLFNQLYMFSPTLDPVEAAAVASSMNSIILVSQFDDDFDDMRQALGLPTLPILHSRRRSYEPAIDPNTLASLRLRLQPEYDLLALLTPTELIA